MTTGDTDATTDSARSAGSAESPPVPTEEMVRVELLEIPVQLWARANDESKDLLREFALIVLNRDRHVPDVPAQLLDLIEELEATYGTFGKEQTERFERARAEEEAVIDQLEWIFPRGTENDIERLAHALDEADEYCRQGQHLLSLASSPAAKAFRDWFLDEFSVQLRGGSPTPWPLSPYAAAAREAVAE
jgi:ElaB/YqjD/DUF883 family membrane-anchored ribosome-binding protein